MFGFKISPIKFSGPSSRPAFSPHRTPLTKGWVIALAGAGVLTGWLLASRHARLGDMEPDTGPLLVAIRKIGDLHTASFTLKDVVHQESQVEPEGWAATLPGAEAVTHWATHNQALVVAEGNVEAGVDLSRLAASDITTARTPDGATRVRVHLPDVTVYAPNVHLRVENSRAGLLWRDENLVPKAQAQAARRFLKAAEQGDLRGQARTNAVQTLQQMYGLSGFKNVEFYFTS